MSNDCSPLLAFAHIGNACACQSSVRAGAVSSRTARPRQAEGAEAALLANHGAALLTLQHREARCRRSEVARSRETETRAAGAAAGRALSVLPTQHREMHAAGAAQGGARCRRSDRGPEVCAVAASTVEPLSE